MPTRPREHELEDQSRLVFRRMLPSKWVFRDFAPDYGIDGTVEVFDEKGAPTGIFFAVQLKATDRRFESRFDVHFSRETALYYRSLDLPVLVVLFHAPSGRLFARWFHTYDPYYERRRSRRKTVTFRLSVTCLWGLDTATRLLRELYAMRIVKSHQLSLPVPVGLVLAAATVHGVQSEDIASAIREVAQPVQALVALVQQGGPECIATITIGSDATSITLGGGISGITLHTRSGFPQLRHFAAFLLVALGVALSRQGHDPLGAQLVSFAGVDAAPLLTDVRILLEIGNCLSRAFRVRELLDLIAHLAHTRPDAPEFDLLFASTLLRRRSLSLGQSESLHRLTHLLAERAIERQEPGRAASLYYSLGNHLRRYVSPRAAFRHYQLAVRYDPSYKKRGYFWREAAGILFEARHYQMAALFYKKALDLGESGVCLALYADALTFAGKYRRALAAFRRFLRSAKTADCVWKLKAMVVRILVDSLSLGVQRRAPDLAQERTCRRPSDRRTLRSTLKEHDALCPTAWFNLGVTYVPGDPGTALRCFLAAAVIDRSDIEAWTNCIGLALQVELPALPMIVCAGYQANGDTLLTACERWARKQASGFPRDQFIDVLRRLAKNASTAEEPRLLRFFGPKGKHEGTIEVSRDALP